MHDWCALWLPQDVTQMPVSIIWNGLWRARRSASFFHPIPRAFIHSIVPLNQSFNASSVQTSIHLSTRQFTQQPTFCLIHLTINTPTSPISSSPTPDPLVRISVWASFHPSHRQLINLTTHKVVQKSGLTKRLIAHNSPTKFCKKLADRN